MCTCESICVSVCNSKSIIYQFIYYVYVWSYKIIIYLFIYYVCVQHVLVHVWEQLVCGGQRTPGRNWRPACTTWSRTELGWQACRTGPWTSALAQALTYETKNSPLPSWGREVRVTQITALTLEMRSGTLSSESISRGTVSSTHFGEEGEARREVSLNGWKCSLTSPTAQAKWHWGLSTFVTEQCMSRLHRAVESGWLC